MSAENRIGPDLTTISIADMKSLLKLSILLVSLCNVGTAVAGENESSPGWAEAWSLNSSAERPSWLTERSSNRDWKNFKHIAPTPSFVPLSAAKKQVVYFFLPDQVKEGTAGTAVLRFKYPEKNSVTFSVRTHPEGLVRVPFSVTMGAGKTQTTFGFTTINDTKVNLTRRVTFELSVGAGSFWIDHQLELQDDEKAPVLKLAIPSRLVEGEATSTGMLTLSSPADVNCMVSFSVSNPEADLRYPTNVKIPAGETSATFPIRSIDDRMIEPVESARLTAQCPGLRPANALTKSIDDESHSLQLILPSSVVEGRTASGIVRIGGLLPDDLEVRLKTDVANAISLPSRVVIPKGKMTAPFSVAAVDQSYMDVSRVVTVTASAEGFSEAASSATVNETFAAGRKKHLALPAEDLVWDPVRQRIYASVPARAGPRYRNRVVAIDPVTLRITASVAVNFHPGQLAMTSGGEALYVVRNESGNGGISQISLDDFKLTRSYAIGRTNSNSSLYASDITTVAGQPDLLIVSQYHTENYNGHHGVALYDKGVRRSLAIGAEYFCNRIEPSADPTVFFGYNSLTTEFGFRKLLLGPQGLTIGEGQTYLIHDRHHIDIRSQGNTVFATTGLVVDGARLANAGRLGGNVNSAGFGSESLVCPDLAKGRIYHMAAGDPDFNTNNPYAYLFRKIVAYDPITYLPLHVTALGRDYSNARSLVRWGDFGLAFRTDNEIVLMENQSLIPSSPATDLEVTVQAGPDSAGPGTPLTYTVSVTNLGTNVAVNTIAKAVISARQKISSVSAGPSVAAISRNSVSVPFGNLAPAETRTLVIVTTADSYGTHTCTGAATSLAVDPVAANNSAVGKLNIKFRSGANVVNVLDIAANNLVEDASRGLVWASVLAGDMGSQSKVAAIDPLTGIIATTIPLGAPPITGAMALSGNGRYLYVGLFQVPAVHRIDLATAGYPSVRIPLVDGFFNAYARDIAVLEGDGTSFAMIRNSSGTLEVYDGMVRRPLGFRYAGGNDLQPTGTPGQFTTFTDIGDRFYMRRFLITTAGIEDLGSVFYKHNPRFSFYHISGHGDLTLTATGHLFDASKKSPYLGQLGSGGIPCLDEGRKRAYVVTSSSLQAFDTGSGSALGRVKLPPGFDTNAYEGTCIRWGADGLAITGENMKVCFVRWSVVNPAPQPSPVEPASQTAAAATAQIVTTAALVGLDAAVRISRANSGRSDSDGDGISDGLEYLFGSSLSAWSANPLHQENVVRDEVQIIRLRFPRRAGVTMPAYRYEFSKDQTNWFPLQEIEETVTSTSDRNGVRFEDVDAVTHIKSSAKCVVRLRWNP